MCHLFPGQNDRIFIMNVEGKRVMGQRVRPIKVMCHSEAMGRRGGRG